MNLLSLLKSKETKNKTNFTHTTLGDYCSKYAFSKNDNEKLFSALHKHVFEKNKEIYLTERHPINYSKICIDIDLRYDTNEKQRKYTQDDIKQIILFYHEIFDELIPDLEEDAKMAYVFEKKNGKMKKNIFCDGFHIMFPFLEINYQAQHKARMMAIEMMKEYELFSDCMNPIDEILDKAVVQRNNWFMYGASKPKSKPYLITGVYDAEMEEYELPEITPDFIGSVSIQNQGEETLTNEIEEEQEQKEKIMSPQIEGHEMPIIKKELIRGLLNILRPERADNYDDWLIIGASLFNTSAELLDLFKEWSSQSDKYDEQKCENLWDGTYSNHDGSNKVGLGTLRKLAREDDKLQYNNIIEAYGEPNEIKKLLLQGTSCTHQDMAELLYYMNRDKFVYCGENMWYAFCEEDGKWISLNKEPMNLHQRIKYDVIKVYEDYAKQLCPDLDEQIHITKHKGKKDEEETDEHEDNDNVNFARFIKKTIVKMLKNAGMKSSIISESKDFFYDKKFKDKLDVNPYLLAFTNGVLDLKTLQFRKVRSEDYVSMTTGFAYTYETNQETKDEIMKIITVTLPDDKIRDFTLTYLASTLIGHNQNEKFVNFEGSGGNGKGLLTSLHAETLGEYADVLNNNYLVNTFNSPESHNTMLANIIKRRYVQVNEPPDTKTLNINLIKELTGGDKIQLRSAHSAESIAIEPMFKLVMLFNRFPKVHNTQDGGFQRRFIGINFPNKFIEGKPKRANEYKKDPQLKNKIKNNIHWKQQYMLILISHLRRYIANHENLNIPTEIIKRSAELLTENDPIKDFINTMLNVGTNKNIFMNTTDVWEEYKSFYRENYNERLKCSSKQFRDQFIACIDDDNVQYRPKKTIEINGKVKTFRHIITAISLREDEPETSGKNTEVCDSDEEGDDHY
jgi:P4 family phage/plasmid primase-like protien